MVLITDQFTWHRPTGSRQGTPVSEWGKDLCKGVRRVSCFRPQPVASYHTASHSFPYQQDWGWNQKGKRQKTHVLRWRQFTGESKSHPHKANKAKQRINSLFPMGRQLFSHLLESRAPSCITLTWKDKLHHSTCLALLPYFLRFIYWAWTPIILKISLVRLGDLSLLCLLPASQANPHSLPA